MKYLTGSGGLQFNDLNGDGWFHLSEVQALQNRMRIDGSGNLLVGDYAYKSRCYDTCKQEQFYTVLTQYEDGKKRSTAIESNRSSHLMGNTS